jgi:hypothetical protein
MKDGWTAVYFTRDERIQDEHPIYAKHARRALRRGTYHGIEVDTVIKNFRPATWTKTKKDPNALDVLLDVPFFYGIARSGDHTFVGSGDEVNEMHWGANPNDAHAVEQRSLSDARFAWDEGLLMLPPASASIARAAAEGRVVKKANAPTDQPADQQD